MLRPPGLEVADPLPAWSLADPGGASQRAAAASGRPRSPASGPGAGSSGAGVRVCVVDSGIEPGHPAVGELAGAYTVAVDEEGYADVSTDETGDVSGHGTACASVIRALAPDCELTSMRVLTRGARARGAWAWSCSPGSPGRSRRAST